MKKTKVLFLQIIKYGLVGVLNTLLTAVVIWLILLLLSNANKSETPSALVMFTANVLGYLAGLINSFILNRKWTFKSSMNWKVSSVRFFIAFGICYFIQLVVVLGLNSLGVAPEWQIGFSSYTFTITSAYFCQLTGIIVYSALNFPLNKYYTFKERIEINANNIGKKDCHLTHS